MGKVTVKEVVLKNHRDENAVELGVWKADQVRTITLDMIADTGAVEVSLPHSMVEKLGLPFVKKVKGRSFDGQVRELNMYRDLSVYIMDREAIVYCIGIPEEKQKILPPCLLGQIVFEQMNYLVDCRNQRIIPNPDAEGEMMTFEMY